MISYGEFVRKNPHASKEERINTIKRFYDYILKNVDNNDKNSCN